MLGGTVGREEPRVLTDRILRKTARTSQRLHLVPARPGQELSEPLCLAVGSGLAGSSKACVAKRPASNKQFTAALKTRSELNRPRGRSHTRDRSDRHNRQTGQPPKAHKETSDEMQTDMTTPPCEKAANFGSPAGSRGGAPGLCVPTSRSVCLFGLSRFFPQNVG